MDWKNCLKNESRTADSSFKVFTVHRLNEDVFFVSSSMLADSFVLRNRQLLVAANRYSQFL